MEYTVIGGFRTNSTLIYVHKEKCLFLKKNERNSNRTYICYQAVLSKRQLRDEDHTKCTACVVIGKNGECFRNKIQHTSHRNHRSIYADLCSIENMKNKCDFIKNNLPISGSKISVKEIFCEEIAA